MIGNQRRDKEHGIRSMHFITNMIPLRLTILMASSFPEVDDIQAKINNVNETYVNYMKQIAFGKYSGSAEDIVAEMQAALKQAGIEDVTAELQAQFDALYK